MKSFAREDACRKYIEEYRDNKKMDVLRRIMLENTNNLS